jgi:hypothetical protein
MSGSPTLGVTPSDLFSAYGRALYLAQHMELGMRIFYTLERVLPSTPPGKAPRVNFEEEPLLELNTNSLGGFIRQFRRELFEEGEIDDETRLLMRRLEQSADDRNWLVHTYWWERYGQSASVEGRVRMLNELQNLINQFQQYDRLIHQLVTILLAHYKVDPQKISSDKFQGYFSHINIPFNS